VRPSSAQAACAVVDRLIELRGLGQRAHAELAVEQAHALPVLPQCLGAFARRCQQLDQAAVGRLVERIEGETPPGVRNRLVVAPSAGERGGEAAERRAELAAQFSGRRLLPAVELDAVAQAESGQQVVAVQRDRLREPRYLLGRVRLRGGQLAKPADVELCAVRERDRRPVYGQPLPCERRLERRERSP
jgi:hypothetical protein